MFNFDINVYLSVRHILAKFGGGGPSGSDFMTSLSDRLCLFPIISPLKCKSEKMPKNQFTLLK